MRGAQGDEPPSHDLRSTVHSTLSPPTSYLSTLNVDVTLALGKNWFSTNEIKTTYHHLSFHTICVTAFLQLTSASMVLFLTLSKIVNRKYDHLVGYLA